MFGAMQQHTRNRRGFLDQRLISMLADFLSQLLHEPLYQFISDLFLDPKQTAKLRASSRSFFPVSAPVTEIIHRPHPQHFAMVQKTITARVNPRLAIQLGQQSVRIKMPFHQSPFEPFINNERHQSPVLNRQPNAADNIIQINILGLAKAHCLNELRRDQKASNIAMSKLSGIVTDQGTNFRRIMKQLRRTPNLFIAVRHPDAFAQGQGFPVGFFHSREQSH